MDFKVVVAAIAVAFSGFLFYQNQKRSDMLIELSRKYEASVQQAQTAGASAVLTDQAVMEVIRQQVKAELAARPEGNCNDSSGPRVSGSDAAKIQDLNQRLMAFERKFNKAASELKADRNELTEKITAKATKLKEKIVALCKK